MNNSFIHLEMNRIAKAVRQGNLEITRRRFLRCRHANGRRVEPLVDSDHHGRLAIGDVPEVRADAQQDDEDTEQGARSGKLDEEVEEGDDLEEAGRLLGRGHDGRGRLRERWVGVWGQGLFRHKFNEARLCLTSGGWSQEWWRVRRRVSCW